MVRVISDSTCFPGLLGLRLRPLLSSSTCSEEQARRHGPCQHQSVPGPPYSGQSQGRGTAAADLCLGRGQPCATVVVPQRRQPPKAPVTP